MNMDRPQLRMRPLAALVATLALAALGACNKPGEPRTNGDRSDSAVSQAERRADQTGSGVNSAARDAGRATERAVAEVGDKVKDAAITTAVNAKLAQDSRLSALSINVDTVNGRVALRGTAPDAASRERAQQLASSVDGVVSVDNQLVVSAKG